MHWYKRNIGDYAKKAGRLTMLQHGSYTLLMDACYDRERFPTMEEAIEWTWASSKEEIEALEFVLKKFFTLEKDGTYTQARVLEELLDYHSKADKNKQIAIERETKRREKSTSRARSVNDSTRFDNESPPNQEPVTSNQEPRTKIKTELQAPNGVCLSVWTDFMKFRKALKAPITETAINGFKREAAKAGISLEDSFRTSIENNWRGFKAEWVKDQPRATNGILAGAI
ncbi:MAG: YdaU family protein [Pseudomonadota bacterium]|nr:YdaU family protein [Pseudomonadota bacterium]